MNELTESRVFLGRAAHDGEGPNGIVPTIDVLDSHHGKVMGQTVVSQMIAEGSLGQKFIGNDSPRDAKIRIAIDRQSVVADHHRNAAAGERPGKCQFAQSFGQGHHGSQRCAA